MMNPAIITPESVASTRPRELMFASFDLDDCERKVAEESVQADAANIQARQNLAKTYSMLGVIAVHLERFDEAVAYLQKSFAEDAQADSKNFFSVRKLATLHAYIGETYEASAGTLTGAEREAHLQAAKENYRRAFDHLSQMKARGAINEKDREFFEKVQAAAQ